MKRQMDIGARIMALIMVIVMAVTYMPILTGTAYAADEKDEVSEKVTELPADEQTRSSFTAPEGYEWCSCDFSALESRLGADIYNEPHMIEEFLHGSGDIHSLMALTFFEDQMEPGITDLIRLFFNGTLCTGAENLMIYFLFFSECHGEPPFLLLFYNRLLVPVYDNTC